MNKGIEAVKGNKMGWLLASKPFNVPQARLRRHYYSVLENLRRLKPTLNVYMQKELAEHVFLNLRNDWGWFTSLIEMKK